MKARTPTQKTSVPTEAQLKQQWYLVDVKGKTLGQVAVKIADLLRGKGKVFFTPQQDCGDFVVAINAKDIRLAGNKMETKMYRWHTQYPGGLREFSAKEVMTKKPDKILYDAVWGMLPRNKLRKKMMRKFHIFPTADHGHEAQSPKPINL